MVPGAYRNQHQSYDHIHAVWSEQRAHDADCKVVSGRKEPRRARFSCRGKWQICGGAGGKFEKRALLLCQEHNQPGAACGGRSGRCVPWVSSSMGDVGNVVLPELSPDDDSFSTHEVPSCNTDGTSGGLPMKGRCLRGLSARPLCGDHGKGDVLLKRKSAIFVYISFHTACGHRESKRLVPKRTTNVQA